MNYKVIDSAWLSGINDGNIGAVAVDVGRGNWKAYLGVVASGQDEEQDKDWIASGGAKLGKAVACAFFPKLDPERFVY